MTTLSRTVSVCSADGRTSAASRVSDVRTDSSNLSRMSAISCAASSSRSDLILSSVVPTADIASASSATPQTQRTTLEIVNSIMSGLS